MMSPRDPASDSRAARPLPVRQTPLQVLHVLGNFMRIWSVYALYHHLSQSGDSVILFIFCCLVPASIIFLFLQKPWRGRPLQNSQVVPTIINGAIMALFLILWGKGLLSCGPLITLLAEYAGAVLGVVSALFYGRRVSIWKKVGGLAAMSASFYFLSIGWAKRSYSPFYSFASEPIVQVKQSLGFREMTVPILAGILSALRRVMARRVSLKNQLKRRLHAISVASAACFLFPLAMWDTILGSESNSIANLQFLSWAYLSTIIFGVVLIFYFDNLAEERNHAPLAASFQKHFFVPNSQIALSTTNSCSSFQHQLSTAGFNTAFNNNFEQQIYKQLQLFQTDPMYSLSHSRTCPRGGGNEKVDLITVKRGECKPEDWSRCRGFLACSTGTEELYASTPLKCSGTWLVFGCLKKKSIKQSICTLCIAHDLQCNGASLQKCAFNKLKYFLNWSL